MITLGSKVINIADPRMDCNHDSGCGFLFELADNNEESYNCFIWDRQCDVCGCVCFRKE